MPYHDYDIGIIGGGAAGLTVAAGCGRLGAKTILIEKESKLGGDCLHFGCVPSKTLIRSAQVYHLQKMAGHFGLPAQPGQPVDFKKVADRIRAVVARIQQHDSVARFTGLGAEVAFGAPRFTDEYTVELDGRSISAKNWLVATGSSAAIPPIEGLDRVPYLTNRELFYLDELPESLIILGGGPIAMEMAQAFCRLGSKITVIQRSDQILSKEDRDMADLVMLALQQEGVTFHLNCKILRVNSRGREKQVVIETGDGLSRTVSGAEILVALGRSVNISGLGLKEIGINYDQRGIKVDRRLRTSHKHIFAAGDVIGGYQFTHAAGYEGGIVVTNAIFHLPRKVDYTWMPWCTYTTPELASIGMNEKMAIAAGLDYRVWSEDFADNDRGLAAGYESGRIKLLIGRRDKPIGVQITGPHAGELLGEWIATLNGKLKLSGLAGAIHPYPTLIEINKKVAGAAFSEKIFGPGVRKILKLLFNFRGRQA